MGIGPEVKCDTCGRTFFGGKKYEHGKKNYCYECLVPMANSITEEQLKEMGPTQKGFFNMVNKMGGLEESGGTEYWIDLLKTNAGEKEKSEVDISEEEFEAGVQKATELVSANKFDAAIVLASDLYERSIPLAEPFVSIWPAGIVVAALAFKHKDHDPAPGSMAYNDLRKYVSITLKLFGKLTGEQQQHYSNSNPMFSSLNSMHEILEQNRPLSDLNANQAPKKSGCFIATAVYGDENAYEVEIFRQFRDEKLMKIIFGKLFIHFYYTVSPKFAKIVSKSEFLQITIRAICLDPFVKILTAKKNQK